MSTLLTTKNNSHIAVLDSLRAFAALSVCLYHFVCTTTGYIQTEWILNVFSFGKYGVQMFFVISGFIIPWSMHKAGYTLGNFFQFFLKRLARLEPPYLVSLAIAIVILLLRDRLLGPSENLQPLSTTRVVLHFGYLVPFFEQYEWINQVYWTLAVEFQYYLFVALVFIPLTQWGLVARIVSYAGFLLLGLINGHDFLPHWLPIFLLGILIFLFRSQKISVREYYTVTLLTLVYGFFRYDIGELLFSALAVAAIVYRPALTSRLGDFFGDLSYSLYLIHPVIGATLINVLSHRITHPAGKAAVIALGVGVTILGSWIMYRLIEKPSKKLSSAITYGKKRSSGAGQTAPRPRT